MCDRLVRKGLFRRRQERDDRRRQRVTLIDRARVLVGAVTERRRREIECILGEVPSDKQALLVEVLG
jgi:DNA-binding MarR family transcriptional regulator